MSYYHPFNLLKIAWKSILKTRGLLLAIDLLTLAAYYFLLRAITPNPLLLVPLFILCVALYLITGSATYWRGEADGLGKTALHFICRINGLELENEDPLFQERIDNLFKSFMEGYGARHGLVFNQIKPWQYSRPDKQQRDRQIWELRNNGETWEAIAEKTNTAVMTVRNNYARMLKLISQKPGSA